MPVGSDTEVSSDFQLICGTNCNLRQDVADGKFREDLLARINIWSFKLHGLADRPEDIGILASHFLDELALAGLPEKRLSPGALEALDHHPWPGNIRQLRNVLEQAVIRCDGPLIMLPTMQRILAQGAAGMAESTPPYSPETRVNHGLEQVDCYGSDWFEPAAMAVALNGIVVIFVVSSGRVRERISAVLEARKEFGNTTGSEAAPT